MTRNDYPANPVERMLTLAVEYRVARARHRALAGDGRARRRAERTLKDLAELYEGLLERWVPDEDTRARWYTYFYEGGPVPAEPELSEPPLFRGRGANSVLIDVVATSDGGYDVFVGDHRAEHHAEPWELEHARGEPFLLGERRCPESFRASDAAVAALRGYLSAPGASPPWRWAWELFQDGLIDADFGLTARGQRRLSTEPLSLGGEPEHYCVIVANAGRARVFSLARFGESDEALTELLQVFEMNNPEARRTPHDQFSDSRPGLQQAGGDGPAHGVSDRRDHHRAEADRRFFAAVVAEAAGVWRQRPRVKLVIAGGPPVIGALRPLIEREKRQNPAMTVVEVSSDLTRLAGPALHDALARAGVIPPRQRRAPVPPMRTPNPWSQGG
jgi:hypothetical protein